MDLDLAQLDLGYLALFVGQRVTEVVTERMRADGFADVRATHGYVIQHLLGGPRTITELAGLLGVTQQAASKTVAELVACGWADAVESAADRRARIIALSAEGHELVAHARKVRKHLHAKLGTKHGVALERARKLLAEVLEELGGADAVRRREVRAPR